MRSLLEKKIILTIISFAFVAILIVVTIVAPTIKQIRIVDQETYNLRLALEKKNERIANYRRSLKQIERIKKEMPNFSQFLFSPGQELNLITTLEGIAAKNGVVQHINTSNLDNIANQRIAMSLSANGPYSKTLSYLNELEKLPYFLTVTRVHLTSFIDRANPNQPTSPQLNMNIDFRLYVTP